MPEPVRLGVNIDHVATVRQVRRAAYPDPVEAARLAERGGAHGITVHLREDRRHIQDHDVLRLRAAVRTKLNLEMAATPEMCKTAIEIGPDDVCIVPERREELTTEGGLDAAAQKETLREVVASLRSAGITSASTATTSGRPNHSNRKFGHAKAALRVLEAA